MVEDVDLDIASGEILGLVGPNGCGKSTVIKVLSGFHQPDTGAELIVEGELLRPDESRHQKRMAFVHQDLGLVPSLPVVENLALGTGYRTGRLWHIDWSAERRRSAEVVREFEIRATPDTLVRDLAPADVTLLAIARALASIPTGGRSLLVLDEPTSTLTETEVERVLTAIRAVAAGGVAVLFVSHRIREVVSLCTRINVMRDGRIVADLLTAGIADRQVVELMLGRPLEPLRPHGRTSSIKQTAMSVRGLSGRRLRDFSLDIGNAEIVGVTGLLGSGKTELGRLLAGVESRSVGEVSVSGKVVALRTPREAIAAGIAYVPPERRTHSIVSGFSALENLTLPNLGNFWNRGWLDKGSERQETLTWMGRTHTTPAEPNRQISRFSGGNQQKLVFAKWIRTDPQILILDEPTHGVDVGAAHELYELIRSRAESGLAVLLLSSEWDDLARVCDRVFVLERGRTVAELHKAELSSDSIAAAAFGSGRAHEVSPT